MRKPVHAKCEQQRRRSACASAQPDQRLCCSLPRYIIPPVSISEISSLFLASVAVQACLSLPWSQTRVSRDVAHFMNAISNAFVSICNFKMRNDI